jgi:catechol 2,3-dioxygenase-like lactoylglutathione lyase family enzyme
MQSRGIHHLDLVVSDIERSKSFYSELLRGLGWSGVLELEGERGEAIW